MNYLFKFMLNLLLTLFVCCIFGAFIEGNINIVTWDENVKMGIISLTILINIYYFMFREII